MGDPGPTSVRSSIRKKLPGDGDWDAVPTAPSQFLEVEILTRPDDLAAAETAVESAGGAVWSSHGSRIVGDVPADSVTTVAQSDAVRLVGEVVPPQEHALPATEGLEITRAADLHDEGVTGQDVTIAVLDSRFDTSNPKYEDQVVATIGPDAYFSASGAHGDATAEITAGMAPDADLVLATVFGMDIFNVIDELENNYPEVEVATMSVGYYPIRLDGGDPYSQRIGAFTADDRLFTTSAGNASAVDNAWQWDDTNDQAVPIAQEYGTVWHGAWRDPDGDRLFEFDEPSLPNDERLPVSTSLSDGELGNMDANEAVGWIAINWDADWVTDDQRYRVRLYDDANATYPVEESFTTTPFEEVIPEAQDFLAGDDYVHVEIEQVDATGDEYFDIWAWGNDLQFDLPWAKHDRCIGLPGTSQDEDTLAIAAVQAVELETTGIAFAKNKGDLKPYSSQGPTQDGRRGIDLAGPSHVSTVAYGDVETNFGFNGTSAACPHVGGGAGLLLGINGITTDEVRNSMLATGTGIPDSEVGAPSETNTKIGDGYLDVYAASQTADADYEIAVAGSVDVPDRTVLIDDDRLGENSFTVTAIGRAHPGDDLAVSVSSTVPTKEYQVEFLDKDLNTVAASSTIQGNAQTTFDTTGLDHGSYALAVMRDGEAHALFPVVLSAWDVTVTSAPSQLETGDSLTVTAEVSPVDSGETIDNVALAVMSDDSDTGGTTEMTEVSTNTYEGTITDLSADEYHQGVAVRGMETVSFDVEGVTVEENNVDTEEVDLSSGDTDITTIIEDNAQEVIGFSDVHELTVTVADVDELAQKWSVDRSGRLQHSTPAVNNEFVFVGGLDDSLVSIWRNTGDADWTFDRLGALSDSSPLLANGSLYIGSGGGTFYSLDPGTGGSNWQVQLDSAITSSPASMNGTVYFASNDGMLHAVDTSGASGTLQNTTWSVDVGGPVYSDVAAANGMIYVTTNDGDVVAVDDTGTEQWRVNDGAEFGASSPVYHNGSLYVGGQSVWRLDPSDGSLIWDTGYSGNVGSSPVVDNGVVFIGDASGTVMTLNVSDGGTTLWNTQTANGVATTPGLTSDRVITGGLGGRVHVFDRANGDVIASKDLGAPIRSSPVVDNDVIYIGTEAGTLFALQNIP